MKEHSTKEREEHTECSGEKQDCGQELGRGLQDSCNAERDNCRPRQSKAVGDIHTQESENSAESDPGFVVPAIGRSWRVCTSCRSLPHSGDGCMRKDLDSILVKEGDVESEEGDASEIVLCGQHNKLFTRKLLYPSTTQRPKRTKYGVPRIDIEKELRRHLAARCPCHQPKIKRRGEKVAFENRRRMPLCAKKVASEFELALQQRPIRIVRLQFNIIGGHDAERERIVSVAQLQTDAAIKPFIDQRICTIPQASVEQAEVRSLQRAPVRFVCVCEGDRES